MIISKDNILFYLYILKKVFNYEIFIAFILQSKKKRKKKKLY